MLIQASYHSEITDKPIILRFNYTETRELFENLKYIAKHKLDLYPRVNELSSLIDTTNGKKTPKSGADICNFGSYYHDIEKKKMYMCLSAQKMEEGADG